MRGCLTVLCHCYLEQDCDGHVSGSASALPIFILESVLSLSGFFFFAQDRSF